MLLQQLYEAREEYIAQQQGDKIMVAYNKDNGQKPKVNSPIEVVKLLSQASRPNVQWVVKQYVQRTFKLEDIERLKSDLLQFNQLKQKLPADKRDLNRYPSLQAVYQVIDQDKEQKAAATQADENKGKEFVDKNEAEVIFKRGNASVVIPKTREASCWFGKDTRWCTARNDEKNMFASYSTGDENNLYIITAEDGTRYQGYTGIEAIEDGDTIGDIDDEYGGDLVDGEYDNVWELTDANDQAVDAGSVMRQHPELKDAFIKIGEYSGLLHSSVYDDYSKWGIDEVDDFYLDGISTDNGW